MGGNGNNFRPYKTRTIKLKSEFAKTVGNSTGDCLIGFKISARISAQKTQILTKFKKG